ncbi:RNA 2'-phosphotransferase [Kutzneria buriramensis]|uniref:Probable RNA 2'-phosphotransferase n=1 Tax=Kutzneria buriramensis TaxID=1045776 RepID=A0A3E0I011_9PSEU|nr:RNA 2'-phosphotransferase [Kutzneria buriramensis]REH52057.1 putative RNA 2'-phosphotransferase [Kutzneria buriramensis]
MNEKDTVRLSKRLSRHLRHAPEEIGIQLTTDGWTDVAPLLAALRITRDQLDHVVETNNKRRFAFDETGSRIRANQGHTVPVELDLPVETPPATLYHGTVAKFLDAIMADGLRPMSRHDVHLSPDVATAVKVGSRRGKPVVLAVDAGRMHADGHVFRLSANGVWFTEHVPAAYLSST